MFSSVLARKYELKAGDNVAVIAENSIWYPVAVFAALRLGLVVTALSPGYGPEELTYMLKLASTTLIVLDSTSAKACKAAGLSIGIPSNSMVSLDDKTDFECIKSLIEQNQGIAAAHPHILLAKASETCAFLSFSSGTTGLPKAVRQSYKEVELLLTALGHDLTSKCYSTVVPGAVSNSTWPRTNASRHSAILP